MAKESTSAKKSADTPKKARQTMPGKHGGTLMRGGVNPGGGRPKGSRNWSSLIRDALAAIDNATKQDNQSVIVAEQVARAKKGDLQAVRFLAEYTDGKPKQTHDVEHGGEVRIVWPE